MAIANNHMEVARFAIDIAFRGRSPILPHAHTVVVPVSAVNKATAAREAMMIRTGEECRRMAETPPSR